MNLLYVKPFMYCHRPYEAGRNPRKHLKLPEQHVGFPAVTGWRCSLPTAHASQPTLGPRYPRLPFHSPPGLPKPVSTAKVTSEASSKSPPNRAQGRADDDFFAQQRKGKTA